MRLRLAMAVLVLGCCAIAACTNSTGGSSTMPGGQLPQQIAPTTPTAAPTPTPNAINGNIQVMGDGNAIALQAPGDFKVTATFPKSASSSPPAPVTLNASVSVPGPGGIPAYGAADKPKNGLFGKGHHEQLPGVLYVTFESDKGANFSSLPVIDVVIPLSVLEAYGTDPTIGLAIYDPANEYKWTRNIAQAINATPTPTPSGGRTATPSPTPTPTQTPTPTPTPSGSPTPRPPGAPSPTPSPTVTPVATPRGPVPSLEMRFVPTQRMMKLLAHKSLSFVVYAEPAATPTPEPTASAKASAAAKPAASASPVATPEAPASAAPSETAAASAAPSASP
jgi:hypothetical protein